MMRLTLEIGAFALCWYLSNWWLGGLMGSYAAWNILKLGAKKARERKVAEAQREADLNEETTNEIGSYWVPGW